MTQSQTIAEINTIITRLPETGLDSLLVYLKEIEKTYNENAQNMRVLNKVFEEDKNLLEKLAK